MRSVVGRLQEIAAVVANRISTTPSPATALQKFGVNSLYPTAFPVQITPQYFRLRYRATN